LTPAGEWDSTAEYLPGTNILKTLFRTSTGLAEITDFMPLSSGEERYLERERQELYRLVEATGGQVRIVMEFAPRFDYARARTTVDLEEGKLVARSGGECLVLTSSRAFSRGGGEGKVEWEWDLDEGERV
jgi:GH15 family glucan-1,4-alpha-glucosidase